MLVNQPVTQSLAKKGNDFDFVRYVISINMMYELFAAVPECTFLQCCSKIFWPPLKVPTICLPNEPPVEQFMGSKCRFFISYMGRGVNGPVKVVFFYCLL